MHTVSSCEPARVPGKQPLWAPRFPGGTRTPRVNAIRNNTSQEKGPRWEPAYTVICNCSNKNNLRLPSNSRLFLPFPRIRLPQLLQWS